MEEIRTALSELGLKAPYTLMPHSISSVYSEHYASKYPDEVQGIISLDGSSTAYLFDDDDIPSFTKPLLGVTKFIQTVGLTSILSPLALNKDNLLSLGYTEKEVNDMRVYAGFNINDILLEQMLYTGHINEVIDLPYPESVPYFKIISKQSYETKMKQMEITPQELQHQHLARIGEHAEFEVLDGTHFIYLNNIDRISQITDDFFK